MRKTRRNALKSLAAVPAAALAQHQHGSNLVEITAAYQPKVLTAAEIKWAAALADTIIPRTDTPGASDAGVPVFFDRALNGNPALLKRYRAGAASLDGKSQAKFGKAFDGITEEQRSVVLAEFTSDPFFKLAKDLTIDGYYSSKDGLMKELGWNANTYLPEFKGCTHPEHQG